MHKVNLAENSVFAGEAVSFVQLKKKITEISLFDREKQAKCYRTTAAKRKTRENISLITQK